jgi:hypothetical protein
MSSVWDFSACSVPADSQGANLEGCNFQDSDLAGKNLQNADLQGANLQGADLARANLSNANLQGALLQGANLTGANFDPANLSSANLSGADASWADFHGADLQNAILQKTKLIGANLTSANLSNADLTGAVLVFADLRRADLQNANFTDAELCGANLQGANTAGAIFTGAKTRDCDEWPWWVHRRYWTWAQAYFGCTNCPQSSELAAPRGDGMNNMGKFLAGFNPTNSAAYLHVISLAMINSNTDIQVTYLGANGDSSLAPGIQSRTNVLEYTTGDASGKYTNGAWQDTGQTNILSGGTGLGVVTNMIDAGGATNTPSRYYRVRVLVP